MSKEERNRRNAKFYDSEGYLNRNVEFGEDRCCENCPNRNLEFGEDYEERSRRNQNENNSLSQNRNNTLNDNANFRNNSQSYNDNPVNRNLEFGRENNLKKNK